MFDKIILYLFYMFCQDITQESGGLFRFERYGDSEMLQNTYFYIENVNAEFAHDPFQLIDLNNDGYQDFVFDLASPGVRNTISACFVYDARQGEFVFPGSFSTKKNVGYDEMWEDVDVEEWSGHEHRYESH